MLTKHFRLRYEHDKLDVCPLLHKDLVPSLVNDSVGDYTKYQTVHMMILVQGQIEHIILPHGELRPQESSLSDKVQCAKSFNTSRPHISHPSGLHSHLLLFYAMVLSLLAVPYIAMIAVWATRLLDHHRFSINAIGSATRAVSISSTVFTVGILGALSFIVQSASSYHMIRSCAHSSMCCLSHP